MAGALNAGGVKKGRNSVDQTVGGSDLMTSALSDGGVSSISCITTSDAVELGSCCIIASDVECINCFTASADQYVVMLDISCVTASGGAFINISASGVD